jgi:hypothetical protein
MITKKHGCKGGKSSTQVSKATAQTRTQIAT